MKIDQEKCFGCKSCVAYCPVNAIRTQNKKVWIEEDECVECGICRMYASCPGGALEDSEMTALRILRSTFSNPLKPHKLTGSTGRGTEEMKTNDVTNRYVSGEFGMLIEVGRPSTGARFSEFEKICKAIAPLGVNHEKANPVYELMDDPDKGTFKKEIINEKVLSGVIEFTAPLEKLTAALDVLKKVEKEVDTVFTVAVISRVEDDNTIPAQEIMQNAGYTIRPNGKTNIGLGRVSK